MENVSGIDHENVMEASRLGIFPSFFFSSLILSEFWVPKVLNLFSLAPPRHFIEKIGEVVAAQLV